MIIDYNQKIPNNVNLNGDRRLQRALERWQPEYLNWWNKLGPETSKEHEVYLRTAISVEKVQTCALPIWLGSFRLCQNARISLGNFPNTF